MDSCKNCKSSISRDSNILFCPQCGADIFDMEHKFKNRGKAKFKEVSIKWQTFFSFVPFMPLLALYKIRKLRKGVILYTLAAAAPFLAIMIIDYILAIQSDNIDRQADIERVSNSTFQEINNYWKVTFGYWLVTSLYLVSSLVMVYFIRKWSIDWNKEIAFLQYLD